MQLQFYSHRNADAIIRYDQYLYKRYEEFLGALLTISDDELIRDYMLRKLQHETRRTNFKSLTPSINGLLKERMSS